MSKTDKCPSCGSTKTETKTITHNQGFMEETWTECKMCKRLKHHWSYGCLFVDNWKDASRPPLRYRIRDFKKRLFTKKRKNDKNKDSDDLPF